MEGRFVLLRCEWKEDVITKGEDSADVDGRKVCASEVWMVGRFI
jgi:hypothetical protein